MFELEKIVPSLLKMQLLQCSVVKIVVENGGFTNWNRDTCYTMFYPFLKLKYVCTWEFKGPIKQK